MGKNFDAWAKAWNAKDAAQKDQAVVNGGSTQSRMTEANNNFEQASMGEELTYGEFIEDPEG